MPNLPYAIYLAIKAKSPVFFSNANPTIKSSGNGTESKFDTLQLIPNEFVPKSLLHISTESIENTLQKIDNQSFNFPLIVKPDVGFRGLLVKKVMSKTALSTHLQKYPINFIIQEFIDLPQECGIFFYKDTVINQFKISSLTLKAYLSVLGDGQSNLYQLIEKDPRAKLYLEYLVNEVQCDTTFIPKKNEICTLSTIGNHSKGTQFIDGNQFITKELEESFNQFLNQVKGFNYGRIDLKYNTLQELYNAQNFKVIEINGIIAEPTHIYDETKNTYFIALKQIRKHWNYLYKISKHNHSIHKIPYMQTMAFIKEIVQLKKYSKHIKRLQKISQ